MRRSDEPVVGLPVSTGRVARLTLTAVSIVGCSSGRNIANERDGCPAPAGLLRLHAADSVVLQETDSIFLGNPGASFSVAPDGSMYIPDYSANRLVVFSASGELVRTLGRTGEGPAEFRMVGAFGLATDRTVIHIDAGARRLNVFDRRSGSFRRSIPYDGYMSWIWRDREAYVFGLVDHARSLAVVALAAREVDEPASDSSTARLTAESFGTPPEYVAYPILRQWNDAKVVRSGDTTVVAFGGLSYLVREIASVGRRDTIGVPACARRGSPKAVLDRWFRQSPKTPRAAAKLAERTDQALSGAGGLWRLKNGQFLVWYQDPVLESGGRLLKGTAFLSLLSPDLGRACVDARVEAPGIGRPRVSFHEDSVLVLDQVVPAEGPPRAVTVVRKYTVETGACSWLPTVQ